MKSTNKEKITNEKINKQIKIDRKEKEPINIDNLLNNNKEN